MMVAQVISYRDSIGAPWFLSVSRTKIEAGQERIFGSEVKISKLSLSPEFVSNVCSDSIMNVFLYKLLDPQFCLVDAVHL